MLPPWARIGPLVLFLVATAWGVLEVHSSTDTWIGLAAGRQILQQTNWLDLQKSFPKHDTFSFTFHGTVWYNQNWLSHVYFWLLYDRLGPAFVIYGTWAVAAGMFLLVLLATRVRSGSWLAATFGAALVASASRDWLSARPATIQFFLFSALWVLLALLLTPGSLGRRRPWGPLEPAIDADTGRVVAGRWWPIYLLVPLFLVWGNAHGSFVFGYGLVALFGGCWFVMRALQGIIGPPDPRRRHAPTFADRAPQWTAITDAQALGVAGAALAALLLTIWLGPYGLENLTHPLKVAESEDFRQVSEWVTPFKSANFPPVQRFWIAFGVAAAAPLVAVALRVFDREAARPDDRPTGAPREPLRLQVVLFDVASVGLGIFMALWARRFAPLMYILAAPALTRWVMLIARKISRPARRNVQDLLIAGTWAAALLVGFLTYTRAHEELVAPFPAGGHDLLDRVTVYQAVPHDAIRLLSENELSANVLTDWTHAGPIMFYAPSARVFMDGRAQQVYSVEHYRLFSWIQGFPESQSDLALAILERTGTDTVMVQRRPRNIPLRKALEQSRDWVQLYAFRDWTLFLRQGSEPLAQLSDRERSGTAWWPDFDESLVARGLIRALMPDPQARDTAVTLFRQAVGRDPTLGFLTYGRIITLLTVNQRQADAERFVRDEQERLRGLKDQVDENTRRRLIQELQKWARTLSPAQDQQP